MALIFPTDLKNRRIHGGMYREIEVVHHLASALPDGYEIYHSVSTHNTSNSHDQFNEIDIVIVDPVGKLILMEVKSGDVAVKNGSLFKVYDNEARDISRQCHYQYSAMRSRLDAAEISTTLTACLVLPDYTILDDHIVAIPKDRIIDASRYKLIGHYVREFLHAGHGCNDVQKLRHFLRNEFRVSISLDALHEQVSSTVRHLSEGLATWVPRIEAPEPIYRISATAGSGKTQLALSLLEESCVKNQSAAYVCYNRPLADHLRTIAPTRPLITNFHELCVEHYRRHVGPPDFTTPDFFDLAVASFIEHSDYSSPKWDLLIIDEAQDFDPNWISAVCAQLKHDGRLYVLEDDDQRLYDRAAFDLPQTTRITCDDNYRSPQILCALINAWKLTTRPINSKNPFKGEVPEFFSYSTERDLLKQTENAIDQVIKNGFQAKDIVVLSDKGRNRSQLLARESIGKYRLQQFTGKYTEDGDPIWTNGEILVDSIYRFKGRSAAAIIISELDFDELSPIEKRKLFVGITRAQMSLSFVLTKQAEAVLVAMVNN